MKKIILATSLLAAPAISHADGFVMGAGRWTCSEALAAWQGEPIAKGQVAGWIFGYWSAATFDRERAFVDRVEQAGGEAVLTSTLSECQNHPDAKLYEVARAVIDNTR